ncbi:Lrp/AsnC family transcriptional regulator [Pannonibacter carbonis]|uniref:Lrp/AsnC family transcriptional regulator n=1 Tax=Pannonibacter carbonis TaxID=2067569 RepID=UPI000D112A4D|nr:Lrp/AsnC family transcriptional regulator [Pannonibacter carbonis]
MPPLDTKDRQIIRALQEDGRLTNQDLAEKVNLSPSPCLRRVRLLEERGVITGYAAKVDPAACGLEITAFIRISLQRHEGANVSDFEARVRRIPEILACYLMTGEADYLLRVVVADLKAYEAFVRDQLHHIPGIASINTSLVYGVVKETSVFP